MRVLVDANILLYAVDSDSRCNDAAREWLEDAPNGTHRVAPVTAFARITSHSGALRKPLPR